MPGRVIFLNGTSSAGKTSLARALQTQLPTPWLYLSADGLLGGFPVGHPVTTPEMGWRPLGRLFYETVALFAAANVDVIAEQVFQSPLQLADAVEVLADTPVWFVGVRCDPDVADERERRRGDRTEIGTARSQVDRVHRHGNYDLEVDTTHLTSEAAAAEVRRCLEREPQAFRTLAAGRRA